MVFVGILFTKKESKFFGYLEKLPLPNQAWVWFLEKVSFPIIHSPTLLHVALTRHHDKGNLGEGKRFTCFTHFIVHHWAKPRWKLKPGASSRNCEGTKYTGIFPRLAWLGFFCNTGPTAQSIMVHSGLALPCQLRKCPTNVSIGPSDRGNSSSEILSSKVALICINLTKTNHYTLLCLNYYTLNNSLFPFLPQSYALAVFWYSFLKFIIVLN